MKGTKIIAKCSSFRWGYLKGDVLEIVYTGSCGTYSAKNITHPTLAASSGYSIIQEHEFKIAPTHEWIETERYTYAIFGIPIYRRTIKEKRAI